MNKFIGLIALIFPLALFGCSSVKSTDVLNFVLPASGYNKQVINYSKVERQGIDIYLPKSAVRKTPIVFVYGGAWRDGNKKDYEFVAHALTGLGHPVIIPDYRLYPKVTFPAFMHDVAMAIKHVESNAIKYMNQPFDKFILMGHSAGAHTAALLATDRQYLDQHKVSAKLVGLIAMAGPYDLPLDDPEVKPVFVGASATSSNPTLNIPKDLPPVLLIHGEADKRVFPKHTHKFSKDLRLAGIPVTTKLYPKANHTQLIGSLAKPLRFLNDSYTDIASFLRKQNL